MLGFPFAERRLLCPVAAPLFWTESTLWSFRYGWSSLPTGASEGPLMITLTRLNNNRFIVNADLIRTVEQMPDTTITLIDGSRIIVRETPEEVVDRSIEYGRLLRTLLAPS